LRPEGLQSGPASSAEIRDRLVQDLRRAGCVFAEDEADAVMADYTGRVSGRADSVSEGLDAWLRDYVSRRQVGEPAEYILGWAEVAGTRVNVGPGVFIPRKWSESLVRRAADLLRRIGGSKAVDLGTGSGALALAVRAGSPGSTIWATEVDPAAAEWARANFGGSPRLTVCVGDLYDALPTAIRGEIGVIFGSLPYVPTEELPGLPRDHIGHEPLQAFDGGRGGLAFVRKALEGAGGWLKPGGYVLFELGAGQGAAASKVATSAGLREVRLQTDDDGGELYLEART
jgi:release factor glutamine methyltransferase